MVVKRENQVFENLMFNVTHVRSNENACYAVLERKSCTDIV